MESRFIKYKNDGQTASDHIANVNSYVNWQYEKGLDLIEKEVADLTKRIATGDAPKMFSIKKDRLIELGECIEKVYEAYHFNKDN